MHSLLKIVLFVFFFACCGFAQNKDPVALPEKDRSVVDSTEIYYDLIADENADSRYGRNIAGMIVGGVLTGGGAYFLAFGVYASFIAKYDDDIDEFASKLAGGTFILLSVPVLAVGIPVLAANIYYYNVHKNHAIKRDRYRESLKRYKQRKESEDSDAVRLMIVPSVNFANASGGVNLLVAF